jgi:hypothetical protein
MSLAVKMVFEILPALVLGFVVGRFGKFGVMSWTAVDSRASRVFRAFKAPLSGR